MRRGFQPSVRRPVRSPHSLRLDDRNICGVGTEAAAYRRSESTPGSGRRRGRDGIAVHFLEKQTEREM